MEVNWQTKASDTSESSRGGLSTVMVELRECGDKWSVVTKYNIMDLKEPDLRLDVVRQGSMWDPTEKVGAVQWCTNIVYRSI